MGSYLEGADDEGLYESLRVERIEHSARRRLSPTSRMKPQAFSFVEAPDVELLEENPQQEFSDSGELGQLPIVYEEQPPSQLSLSDKADSESPAPE